MPGKGIGTSDDPHALAKDLQRRPLDWPVGLFEAQPGRVQWLSQSPRSSAASNSPGQAIGLRSRLALSPLLGDMNVLIEDAFGRPLLFR